MSFPTEGQTETESHSCLCSSHYVVPPLFKNLACRDTTSWSRTGGTDRERQKAQGLCRGTDICKCIRLKIHYTEASGFPMAASAEVWDMGRQNQETLPGDLATREGLASIEPAFLSSIDCGMKGTEEKHT